MVCYQFTKWEIANALTKKFSFANKQNCALPCPIPALGGGGFIPPHLLTRGYGGDWPDLPHFSLLPLPIPPLSQLTSWPISPPNPLIPPLPHPLLLALSQSLPTTPLADPTLPSSPTPTFEFIPVSYTSVLGEFRCSLHYQTSG